MKPRLNIVTLGVRDMGQMRSFYEKLGLVASSASNPHVTFFDMNGVVLALFGAHALAEDAGVTAEEPPSFKGFTLAWNAASEAETDRILSHAAAGGARLVKQAQKVFWGGYSGYFADPEDNLWEVAHNPFFPLDENGRLRLP